MTRPGGHRLPRRLAPTAALTLALVLAACGGDRADPAAPVPRPPAVIAISITPDGVALAPDHVATGPVKLAITNMTGDSQQLAVESTGARPFRQETAPINPQDMAQLRARLTPGSYTVSVRASGVPSASLAVGPTPTASP